MGGPAVLGSLLWGCQGTIKTTIFPCRQLKSLDGDLQGLGSWVIFGCDIFPMAIQIPIAYAHFPFPEIKQWRSVASKNGIHPPPAPVSAGLCSFQPSFLILPDARVHCVPALCRTCRVTAV